MGPPSHEAAQGGRGGTGSGDAQVFELAMMDAFAQGVVVGQGRGQAAGQSNDDSGFEAQTEVGNEIRQHAAIFEQRRGAERKVTDDLPQRGCRPIGTERLDRETGLGERIGRHVDPVEIAVVLPAVLQVIDDLQGRTHGVGRRPGGLALAVHVEHVASDRHGRQAAVMDQVRPVGSAVLGDVEPKCRQEIERMTRRHLALRQHGPEGRRHGFTVASAEQAVLQPTEMIEFFVACQCRIVGHIVRSPNEIVERHDGRPVPRRDEMGRDRKVFIRMRLARSDIAGCRHVPFLLDRPCKAPRLISQKPIEDQGFDRSRLTPPRCASASSLSVADACRGSGGSHPTSSEWVSVDDANRLRPSAWPRRTRSPS